MAAGESDGTEMTARGTKKAVMKQNRMFCVAFPPTFEQWTYGSLLSTTYFSGSYQRRKNNDYICLLLPPPGHHSQPVSPPLLHQHHWDRWPPRPPQSPDRMRACCTFSHVREKLEAHSFLFTCFAPNSAPFAPPFGGPLSPEASGLEPAGCCCWCCCCAERESRAAPGGGGRGSGSSPQQRQQRLTMMQSVY